MSTPQHLDDIVIPDIEIDKGWPVSDVKTIEDCNDAFAFLSAAVATIEFDIEIELMKLIDDQDRLWMAKARCALKYKRAALQIIANTRAHIHGAEKRARQQARDTKLLNHIRRSVDDATFMSWLSQSGCNSELLDIDEAA